MLTFCELAQNMDYLNQARNSQSICFTSKCYLLRQNTSLSPREREREREREKEKYDPILTKGRVFIFLE